jgi:hypothetical protein
VLCYGNAVYRHTGAVYCLDNDAEKTRVATEELARGRTSLWREKVVALVQRIVARQWTTADVACRLPSLVQELLAATPPVTPRLTSSDRMERTITWLADLPAQLLYRQRLKRRRAA